MKNRKIYRKIKSYSVYEDATEIYLECRHVITDKNNINYWIIGTKLNCLECVRKFEELEKNVVEEKE